MSGQQHPHGRQAPPNSAWNHLQVPNFFPSRQPQLAHMSSEHPALAHQPTWHTPTTAEPSKTIPHGPLFNMQQMIANERTPYGQHSPGVDLSLTRNGSQNGDVLQTPISLSVRDTKQINSLPIEAIELTKDQSSNATDQQQQSSPKSLKRSKKVDSILERLNIVSEKPAQSVIVAVSSTNSHDENSNSSHDTSAQSNPISGREDDVVSPVSNDGSLDSSKSRRKRKPVKTVRLSKDNEVKSPERESTANINIPPPQKKEEPEKQDFCTSSRRRSNSEPPASPPGFITRRKTVSESETIDNIAAMVASTEMEKPRDAPPEEEEKRETEVRESRSPIAQPVSVIIKDVSTCSNDSDQNLMDTQPTEDPLATAPPSASTPVPTAAQKKGDTQSFVEVESQLEKMFAGIADTEMDKTVLEVSDMQAEVTGGEQLLNDNVTSTSSDIKEEKKRGGRTKRNKSSSRRSSECNSTEGVPRKKHKKNKKREHEESGKKASISVKAAKNQKSKKGGKSLNKSDSVKDVYLYDSGSNASSSKSRGPFIQIRGPRESPLSVSIVNAPSNEDDPDKPSKPVKNKKYHDDTEYRHKVRSKGLHCSTLSNKYDAQTRDTSWICVFCKRGPHATDPTLPGPSPFVLSMPQYTPGDLFGPYIVTTECPEYEQRIDDPLDLQFKSKKYLNDIKHNKKSRRKRESSESSVEMQRDVLHGMAEAGPQKYEVWVHEDCIVWCSGVYLVGHKIMGLEGAVWGACAVPCFKCGLRGAAVCCTKRGCGSVAHVGCAILSNWQLDEGTYRAYCDGHKRP